jgi:protein gp37
MADVFEARPELDPVRERLWDLIEATPNLDWLLLTKRPQQVRHRVPWGSDWPRNVWLGTTAENQTWAEKRIPVLLEQPAIVRFVSCEPLLGPLDLRQWLVEGLSWVIAGGESGGKARPMQPEWARGLRDQCSAADVPFHFKQWGNWRPADARYGQGLVRMSKHQSGRELDGRTWNGVPSGALL